MKCFISESTVKVFFSDGGMVGGDFQPRFAEPLQNLTVPLGRDATFTCMVHALGGYRVSVS